MFTVDNSSQKHRRLTCSTHLDDKHPRAGVTHHLPSSSAIISASRIEFRSSSQQKLCRFKRKSQRAPDPTCSLISYKRVPFQPHSYVYVRVFYRKCILIASYNKDSKPNMLWHASREVTVTGCTEQLHICTCPCLCTYSMHTLILAKSIFNICF